MTYVRHIRRWLHPHQFSLGATSAIPGAAGRVYLLLFDVERKTKVDGITIQNVATVAGNCTVGVYGPIGTEETCDAAALKASSNSTALSGANAPQFIPFTATVTLEKGRYYMAIEFSDITTTFLRGTNTTIVTGWSQYYDRASGYGALTDPCPTPTNTGSNMPSAQLRCVTT